MPARAAVLIEATSPDSSISVNQSSSSSSAYSITSTTVSESSDSGVQTDPLVFVSYERIHIPPEPSLRDLLVQATGTNELVQVTEIKLQVITTDVSLQYLSIYMPQLTELNLDGSVVTSLRDLGCGLINLRILKVARCGLVSLDGMFGLQNLQELHAESNMIENLSPCTNLPYIHVIDLRKNNIKDINFVSFLALCTNLEHLSLDENEKLIETSQYRKIIKEFLPDLKTLDGRPLDEDEDVINQQHMDFGDISEGEPSVVSSSVISDNCSISVKRTTNENQPFVVSFPPRVLSPRPSSGSSDTSDSSKRNFSLKFPPIHKKN